MRRILNKTCLKIDKIVNNTTKYLHHIKNHEMNKLAVKLIHEITYTKPIKKTRTKTSQSNLEDKPNEMNTSSDDVPVAEIWQKFTTMEIRLARRNFRRASPDFNDNDTSIVVVLDTQKPWNSYKYPVEKPTYRTTNCDFSSISVEINISLNPRHAKFKPNLLADDAIELFDSTLTSELNEEYEKIMHIRKLFNSPNRFIKIIQDVPKNNKENKEIVMSHDINEKTTTCVETPSQNEAYTTYIKPLKSSDKTVPVILNVSRNDDRLHTHFNNGADICNSTTTLSVIDNVLTDSLQFNPNATTTKTDCDDNSKMSEFIIFDSINHQFDSLNSSSTYNRFKPKSRNSRNVIDNFVSDFLTDNHFDNKPIVTKKSKTNGNNKKSHIKALLTLPPVSSVIGGRLLDKIGVKRPATTGCLSQNKKGKIDSAECENLESALSPLIGFTPVDKTLRKSPGSISVECEEVEGKAAMLPVDIVDVTSPVSVENKIEMETSISVECKEPEGEVITTSANLVIITRPVDNPAAITPTSTVDLLQNIIEDSVLLDCNSPIPLDSVIGDRSRHENSAQAETIPQSERGACVLVNLKERECELTQMTQNLNFVERDCEGISTALRSMIGAEPTNKSNKKVPASSTSQNQNVLLEPDKRDGENTSAQISSIIGAKPVNKTGEKIPVNSGSQNQKCVSIDCKMPDGEVTSTVVSSNIGAKSVDKTGEKIPVNTISQNQKCVLVEREKRDCAIATSLSSMAGAKPVDKCGTTKTASSTSQNHKCGTVDSMKRDSKVIATPVSSMIDSKQVDKAGEKIPVISTSQNQKFVSINGKKKDCKVTLISASSKINAKPTGEKIAVISTSQNCEPTSISVSSMISAKPVGKTGEKKPPSSDKCVTVEHKAKTTPVNSIVTAKSVRNTGIKRPATCNNVEVTSTVVSSNIGAKSVDKTGEKIPVNTTSQNQKCVLVESQKRDSAIATSLSSMAGAKPVDKCGTTKTASSTSQNHKCGTVDSMKRDSKVITTPVSSMIDSKQVDKAGEKIPVTSTSQNQKFVSINGKKQDCEVTSISASSMISAKPVGKTGEKKPPSSDKCVTVEHKAKTTPVNSIVTAKSVRNTGIKRPATCNNVDSQNKRQKIQKNVSAQPQRHERASTPTDPRWPLYNFTKPEDCFEAVRNQWGYTYLPNPHRDLTVRFHNNFPNFNSNFIISGDHENIIECSTIYESQIYEIEQEISQLRTNLDNFGSTLERRVLNQHLDRIQRLNSMRGRLLEACDEADRFYRYYRDPQTQWDARYISSYQCNEIKHIFSILDTYPTFYGGDQI